MIKDTECQVCHRLDFVGRDRCEECDWPLKPVVMTEPIFGFDVAIQTRVRHCETAVVEKHFMTPRENVARNRAKNTPSFIKVLAVRPLTETQYVGAYGDPRDKSKFS